MKFAIWCAVSTPEQAKDEKESLAEQERSCRTVGEGKGWMESVQPFIVSGESRTRWVNLRDAENEIPALRAMLESAKRGEFDILVMYDYNRLRDLVDPVAKTLSYYGAQVYSLNQPVEPISPETFTPYASDSESMMRGLAQIISRAQIADLRRKNVYGVVARVKRGLYSLKIPYGYMKGDNGIPVPIPSQARVVIEIKDMWLSGKSTPRILEYLSKNYPSARGYKSWKRGALVHILQNKFYAGKVFYRQFKVSRDPHHNLKRIKRMDSPEILVDGQHQALYSWEEYQMIMVEFERRKALPVSNRYAFSGLLTCSVCGRRLFHCVETRNVWRCAYDGGGTDHISLLQVEAMALIPKAIQRAVMNFRESALPPVSQVSYDAAALAELERQRRRIQDAYESGVYTVQEAEERIRGVEKKVTALKNEEQKREQHKAEYRQWVTVAEEVEKNISLIAEWIQEYNPGEVNQILLRLCKEIVVTPDRQFKVVFRF